MSPTTHPVGVGIGVNTTANDPPPTTTTTAADDDDDDDDDYMNMTFADETSPHLAGAGGTAQETSLQRTRRLKRESLARGIIKSKAQRAREEVDARRRALATSMLDLPQAKTSKGLAMMAKMGFTAGDALGKKKKTMTTTTAAAMDDKDNKEAEAAAAETARTEPIPLTFKDGRAGIGMEAERKRRFREAMEEQQQQGQGQGQGQGQDATMPEVKVPRMDPDEYRERVGREREDARLERQLLAAQRLAERMDDENINTNTNIDTDTDNTNKHKHTVDTASRPPLKTIPVLYRSLVRHRQEIERQRRIRHHLDQSLSLSLSLSRQRLPTYHSDDDDDPDYKTALGHTRTAYDDLDNDLDNDLDVDQDPDLDAFNALNVRERLRLLLRHLRLHHRYCFWCKTVYPDVEMSGCPGLTEEEHD